MDAGQVVTIARQTISQIAHFAMTAPPNAHNKSFSDSYFNPGTDTYICS